MPTTNPAESVMQMVFKLMAESQNAAQNSMFESAGQNKKDGKDSKASTKAAPNNMAFDSIQELYSALAQSQMTGTPLGTAITAQNQDTNPMAQLFSAVFNIFSNVKGGRNAPRSSGGSPTNYV